MSEKVIERDDVFRSLLKCNKVFYSKISKVSQEFYDVYIKKCNEYGEVIPFFEPLYTYLIGYGFSKEKSSKYLDYIKSDVVSYVNRRAMTEVSEQCPKE